MSKRELNYPDDGLTPDVTVNLDWGAEPEHDPTKPVATTADILDLLAAHQRASRFPAPRTIQRVPAALPEPVPQSTQTGSGWPGLREQLADAGDTASIPLRALLGRPEDVLSSGNYVVGNDTASVSIPKPVSGAVDLAMGLPLFGGAYELARGGLREVKPFFSQLARTIEERAPAVATPEQFMAIARKGSKAEELAYSGLEDYLNAAGPKVKKDDVLAHLSANAPELHESMVGSSRPPIGVYDASGNQIWRGTDATEGNAIANRQSGNATMRYDPPPFPTPKFTSYTLPGGENQRELIVTLPAKTGKEDAAFHNWLADKNIGNVLDNLSETERSDVLNSLRLNSDDEDVLDKISRKNLTPEIFNKLPSSYQRALRSDYMRALQDFDPEEMGNAALPPSEYAVPHGHTYGDPALDINRLFHMRMNDRTTATGEKALHLEEIQSDWHQAGREQGYGSTSGKLEPPPGFEVRRATAEDLNAWRAAGNRDVPDIGDWFLTDDSEPGGSILANSPRHMTENEAMRDMHGQIADEEMWPDTSKGVPDAPFKKTWHELGMRRALQEAAAGGYDRLTWTTGAQQADRYSLAKHVDMLTYDPETKILTGVKNDRPVINQLIEPENLPGYVGSDVAKKLLSADLQKAKAYELRRQNSYGRVGATGQYSSLEEAKAAAKDLQQPYTIAPINMVTGPDLQVGGEGMKGFYDKILPDYANKVGKKYGVKVENAEIPITQKGEQYVNEEGTPLTDEELQGIVDRHGQRMHEWDTENIREMSHKDLLDHLGITEDDLKRGGELGHENNRELKHRLLGSAEDMDDEDLGAVHQRLFGPDVALPATRRGIIADIDRLPLTHEQMTEELETHHDYEPGDFDFPGTFADHTDADMRDLLFERIEDRSDREVLQDLLDGDLLKRASSVHHETVHSLKITPEMKKDILSNGQPLFGIAAAAALAGKPKDKKLEDLMSAEATRRHLNQRPR